MTASDKGTVIGLTGGIGVGKTTVASRLSELGATVIDCDGLGRVVVEPDGRAFEDLVDRFGPTILDQSGHIDRPALAKVVFSDPAALNDLNAITHPAIDLEIDAGIEAAPRFPVVLDMAVLVESTLGHGRYSEVLVVEAPLEQRLTRLSRTRNMSRDDALARINSQASDEERRNVADHVIVNDGPLSQLTGKIDAYWSTAGHG